MPLPLDPRTISCSHVTSSTLTHNWRKDIGGTITGSEYTPRHHSVAVTEATVRGGHVEWIRVLGLSNMDRHQTEKHADGPFYSRDGQERWAKIRAETAAAKPAVAAEPLAVQSK